MTSGAQHDPPDAGPVPEWDEGKADALVDGLHDAGVETPVFPMPSLEGFEYKGVRDLGDDNPFILVNTGPLVLAWSSPESAESWADTLTKAAAGVREVLAKRAADSEAQPDG